MVLVASVVYTFCGQAFFAYTLSDSLTQPLGRLGKEHLCHARERHSKKWAQSRHEKREDKASIVKREEKRQEKRYEKA